jgi:hypothetical protein
VTSRSRSSLSPLPHSSFRCTRRPCMPFRPETPSVVAQLISRQFLDPAHPSATDDRSGTDASRSVGCRVTAGGVDRRRGAALSIVGAARDVCGYRVTGVLLALTGIVQQPLYRERSTASGRRCRNGSRSVPSSTRIISRLDADGDSSGDRAVCNDVSRGLRGVRPAWRKRVLWLLVARRADKSPLDGGGRRDAVASLPHHVALGHRPRARSRRLRLYVMPGR